MNNFGYNLGGDSAVFIAVDWQLGRFDVVSWSQDWNKDEPA
jgi:hypothetical protein